jgi:hypothetical protein
MEPTLDTRDQLEWELRDEELDRMPGDGRQCMMCMFSSRPAGGFVSGGLMAR